MFGEKIGRWGPVKYLLKDEYVGRSIHAYGEYNPDETEMILTLASEGDGMCLDIGANIGCISQALISAGYDVAAFEPQPKIFEICAYNIASAFKARHGDDYGLATQQYEVFNCALGNTQEWLPMPRVHYSEKGNFGGLGIGSKSTLGTIDVQCFRLDDYYHTDRKIGFIKIDVEGFELETLRGAYRTIMRERPILYIEDDRIEKSIALRSFIREELKYSIQDHQPTLFREDNFFKNKKNIWNKLYASHNIICRPL